MNKPISLAAVFLALVITAGCSQYGSTVAATPASLSQGAWVAPSGMTLYTFDKDVANNGKSNCNGPCAKLWPPLMASPTDQPAGAFSIVARDDGSHQWAYKGMPLYTYQADQKPGDRNGDKFKDVWHIIKE